MMTPSKKHTISSGGDHDNEYWCHHHVAGHNESRICPFLCSSSGSTGSSTDSKRTFSTTTTTVLAAESKKDQSFQTWSFDGPCPTMAWSELVDATLKMETSYKDADLVIVGVMAPPVEEEDDDDDTDNDVPLLTLTGTAKEIDESLDGALSNLIEENNKAFKNGSGAGSTTPTLRVMSGGKTKRYIVMGLGSIPKERRRG